MTTGTALTPVRGESYGVVATITDGKDRWATLDAVEARMQVRRSRSATATLVDDLTARLTTAYNGNNLVVTLTLTGAQTRALTGRGEYDLFVSDVGATDAQAIRALWGGWTPAPVVTSAA